MNEKTYTQTKFSIEHKLANRLASATTQETIKLLGDYGNKVGEAHKDAIRDISETFSSLFLGIKEDRLVLDLPTGMGKTTAIRAFIKSVVKMGLSGRIIVCCEKVSSLCELKKSLLNDDGVPKDKVYLIHSYTHDPLYWEREVPLANSAPYPSDHNIHERIGQIVLITHSKLHGGFANLKHDLMIYDEGLLLGKSYPIDLSHLLGRLTHLSAQLENERSRKNVHTLTLIGWLKQAIKKIDLALSDDNASGVNFPVLSIHDFDEVVLPIIHEMVRDAFNSGPVGLEDVVEFIRRAGSQEQIRLFDLGRTYGVIFKPTISDDLKRLVVLDASFNVREINKNIDFLRCPKSYVDIRDCSDITLHYARAASGRRKTLLELFCGSEPPVIAEAAKLAKRLLGEGRKVLLFVHKESLYHYGMISDREQMREVLKNRSPSKPKGNRVDPVQALSDALRAELGMSTLPNEISITTWGFETAENRWGNADAVIFVTVNELGRESVFVRRIDQKRDPKAPLDEALLRRMVKSEKANQLLQAIGRAARTVQDGKASRLDAYVFSYDWHEIQPYLTKMLCGVKLKAYEPMTKALGDRLPKQDNTRTRVVSFLNEYDRDEISIKTLWAEVDPKNLISISTRKRVIKDVVSDANVSWERPNSTARQLIRSLVTT